MVCLLLCRAQRDFLTSKMEDVEGKLREAKADRRESERERAMTRALDMMKELFQGQRSAFQLSVALLLTC